ncbi:MAG: alkaline phosphatase family protein [Gemmatimonadota bacterium]|nr:MAG: alkaline phosphatase family protein [Gemmatimonadota bacterium]
MRLAAALSIVALMAVPSTALGYVGPGAGFVFVTSFLALLATGVLAAFSLLLWPFRMAWRMIRRAGDAKPRLRRLVVVGLDGQDPTLTDRLMGEGRLPNFRRLAEEGCYHRLATTFPSVSPVAWSSFATGAHPAKHNIFDFLDRDRRTYLPLLSSVRIGGVKRVLRLGRFRVPIGKPEIRLLRRSRPFWSVLGERGHWSAVLRVPITFPPDRFYGAQLAAMCVPDLQGTQGTFTLFTTRPSDQSFKEGGVRVFLDGGPDRFETAVRGPANELVEGSPPLSLPLVIELDRQREAATVQVDGRSHELRPGELTDWIELGFRAAPGVKVRGICRMMVTEMDEHFSLYLTPINIDPEKPAMPISHPSYYATYLAKKLGRYATLGLAEDTWALNEGVIDDRTFLRLTYDIDREREAMLFAALEKLRRGTVVCVFDATDRIQHMFWRYLEPGHPAAAHGEPAPERDAIEELYEHNDALVGRVRERLGEGDVLMVLSDHGFASFRRGINLNAWLLENGYLGLKEGADGTSEWLRDVDWSRTRAYALGLTGLFLNVQGREAEGIVPPGPEAEALKRELIEKLSGLRDPVTGDVAIREVFDTAALYSGPYVGNGPDMLIGYNVGYRISWDGATGVAAGPIFSDNEKAWSGDHGIDPRLVPGVFFCDRAIDREDPALIDIAPTALWLFGLEPPAYMDGKVLFSEEAPAEGDA